jgi:aquaporin Z
MKTYLAEFIGTFVLVFGGVGSAVIAGEKIGVVGVALSFGLSLLAMAYTLGPISGCHVNPAVTMGMLLTGRIRLTDAIAYCIAQIGGAILASASILFIVTQKAGGYDLIDQGLGANGYAMHSPALFNVQAAFLTETVLTLFLVLTVLSTTSKSAAPGFAGIPIGLVLTMIHLVGIPVTNTSVNPARSIGPALLVGDWALSQLWLFIIAPLIGSLVAAGVYRMLAGAALAAEKEDRDLRDRKLRAA